VKETSENFQEWADNYVYLKKTNEFLHKSELNREVETGIIRKWFAL
jgi:hypothetical protein